MHILVEMNLKLQSVEYVVFDEADRYVCCIVEAVHLILCDMSVCYTSLYSAMELHF